MLASDRPFFVVTGGPGAGKTTLLEALSQSGLIIMSESGRTVIRDQVATSGTALPWADADSFAEEMLALDIQAYRRAEAVIDVPVLFDRGIPDVVGYRRLTGLRVPAHCEAAARSFRYHRIVFAAPPWETIYTQDEERRQTFDEAEATFAAVTEVYKAYGYQVVLLPLDTVEVRVKFVMTTIAQCI